MRYNNFCNTLDNGPGWVLYLDDILCIWGGVSRRRRRRSFFFYHWISCTWRERELTITRLPTTQAVFPQAPQAPYYLMTSLSDDVTNSPFSLFSSLSGCFFFLSCWGGKLIWTLWVLVSFLTLNPWGPMMSRWN